MAISASVPVVEPAIGSVTYDQWFLTQLICKADPTSAPTIVHLRRAATVDGKTVLMPNISEDAEVSFSIDIFKEMVNTPSLAVALAAVQSAVIDVATKKKLL